MSNNEFKDIFSTLLRHVRQDTTDRIYREWERRAQDHPNPFCRYGRKAFSQSDEDGLTLEILHRLGLETGTFAELGVGNGLENNSLVLLAQGWKGFWLGGEELVIDHKASSRLAFYQTFVTLDNLDQSYRQGLDDLGETRLDVVSLDLDGNDFYFVQHLLENNHQPSLFIVEYNAHFPPPIEFVIDYDPEHRWQGDCHFGCSLASYVKLFAEQGYFLVCCNAAMGTNAFFVKEEFRSLFQEIPDKLLDFYAAPNFTLPGNGYGHPMRARTVNHIIR